MSRFKFAVVCLVCASAPLTALAATGAAVEPETGIDVLDPVGGAPWTGDRMHGARERLKDILPGSRI